MKIGKNYGLCFVVLRPPIKPSPSIGGEGRLGVWTLFTLSFPGLTGETSRYRGGGNPVCLIMSLKPTTKSCQYQTGTLSGYTSVYGKESKNENERG